MQKFKRFIKYLGMDGKWHKVHAGRNADITFTYTFDQETQQRVTIIRKGAQSFKAKENNYKLELVEVA